MQSTNGGRRYIHMKQIASTARRRKGVRATLKVAMTGGAGLGILVLLFLASVAYVVFGGTYEVVSAREPETRIAAVAAKPTGAGGGLRNEKASASSAEPTDYFPSAEPTDYFPAGYVNRGRDGDGNVMTYEHD